MSIFLESRGWLQKRCLLPQGSTLSAEASSGSLLSAAACAFWKMGVDVVGKIADLLGVKFAEGYTVCQTDLADRLG